MESHFGHDFSRVRIHADTRAAETARILNAKAYTVGHNIVFGVGQYTPTTYSGQKLLAHELTHIVQQLSDPTLAQPTLLQRQPATKSSSSVTNPDSEQAKLYNLTIGPDVLTNATSTQVIQALKRLYRRLIIKTDSGRGAHEDLIKSRNDQWIVGFFSDTLGGVSMPPLSIWLEPRNRLGAALATLNAGLVDQSVQNLISAEEAYQQAYQRFYTYREGTISGADTSITVLKVTAAAGAIAATVATGGIAAEAGAGLLASSTAVGVVGGTYGATQEAATQTGEKIAGLRREYDLAPILRRGAKDAITNFVGSIVGGTLSGYFMRAFGSYLSKIGDDVLLELGEQLGLGGPLPRDFFLTQGQRFLAEFLGGIGSSPLTTAVGVVVDRLTGGGPMPTPSKFVDMVLEDMVKGGVIQLFLSGLLHAHATSTNRQTEGTHIAEGQSPATPTRAAPEPIAGPKPIAGPNPTETSSPPVIDETFVAEATQKIETSEETGGFQAKQPGVRVPVRKPSTHQPWEAYEPPRVLEVGAGRKTKLGLPPGRKLVSVTRTDIRGRKPITSSRSPRGRYYLDAKKPIPPELVGRFETVIINNPRGYVPDIAELGQALRPGGRIIIQGKAELTPGQRGINPDFQKLLYAPAPPGYRKTVELPAKPILGGPEFFRTGGTRRVSPPNARIIYDKLSK